jgi:hypothetical protein
VTGITKDIYLEITSTSNKYSVGDITDQYAFVVGDVDGDGFITIADVTALVDLIMDGGADADTLQRADVDGNGVVGISDVTALVDMILS